MLQDASISQRELLHVSGALVFSSGVLVFVAATQGMVLDHLALVVGWAVFWIPQYCNNRRDSSWQATIPRALHRKQTEAHLQSFDERGLFAHVEALA